MVEIQQIEKSSTQSEHGEHHKVNVLIKPTLKRYVILTLFCFNLANKSFQWIQVPSSTIKATQFYQVGNYVINFASIIFMLAYLLISWPACFLIEQLGIRRAVLIASFGTIVGSTIKCFSCYNFANDTDANANNYKASVALLLLGQVVIALSEQLVIQIPSRLASIWFPDSQVSSCVSICVLGNQLGIALGFLYTQWLLSEAQTSDQMATGFWQLFLSTLIYSITLFILNWILFDEQPKHAPGAARQLQIIYEMDARKMVATKAEELTFRQKLSQLVGQIGALFKNRDLMLIAWSFGIGIGRGDTISTLLDQMFKQIFPQGTQLVVGNVGFLIVATGALGSPIWGRLLDKYRAYKLINLLIALLTTLTLILFAYSLIYVKSLPAIYTTAALFGFFQTGVFVASFELAVELTYPAPEIITSSLLNILAAFTGPIFILICSYVVDNYGALATNLLYITTLLIAIICILCSREQLKRQEAIRASRQADGIVISELK